MQERNHFVHGIRIAEGSDLSAQANETMRNLPSYDRLLFAVLEYDVNRQSFFALALARISGSFSSVHSITFVL